MQITMQGKYTTRNGRAVRILCVDNAGNWPVVGVFDDGEVNSWEANGTFLKDYPLTGHRDLIPVPEPKPVVHQMWAVMEDGSDTIKYSSYCEQDAEWHCNVFLHETVRLVQWNT